MSADPSRPRTDRPKPRYPFRASRRRLCFGIAWCILVALAGSGMNAERPGTPSAQNASQVESTESGVTEGDLRLT